MQRRKFINILAAMSGFILVTPLFSRSGKVRFKSSEKSSVRIFRGDEGVVDRDGKPNIIFILCDDLGWNQVGYIGVTDFYETPNINRIAQEGIFFTDAYAPGPTCSPTRGAILTGKYPARFHITEYLPGDPYPWARLKSPELPDYLSLEEVTIPKLLKPLGYISALIGKWHLHKNRSYVKGMPGMPDTQGFDFVYFTEKPPYEADPYKDPHNIIELTDQAIQFIERNRDKPLFIYIAHNAIHRPIMEDPELIYKYVKKQGSDLPFNNPIMGAMIERLDAETGRLLKKLDELRLTDNTIVVFTSDNGGFHWLQSQYPLRAGKSTLFEGGIRIPLAVRYPKMIKPGKKCTVPVSLMDFFPTFAEILGIKNLPSEIDGVSLVPLFKGETKLGREALYWHYPHYHRFGYMPAGAIREGNYKLIEWYERSILKLDRPVSLFDLESDIGERNDLASKNQKKAKELWEKLVEWRRKVGALEMSLNPNFDPRKALFWNEKVNPAKDFGSLGYYY